MNKRKAVKYIGDDWNMRYRIKMINFCLLDNINEDRKHIKKYNDNYLQFPCPHDGELTNTNECMYCHKHSMCDIYSTMLDEAADIE